MKSRVAFALLVFVTVGAAQDLPTGAARLALPVLTVPDALRDVWNGGIATKKAGGPEIMRAARPLIFTTTPPTLTDFSWINQGSHFAAQNPSGTMTMFHPGAAGVGFNWGMLVKALPAAPYTIVFATEGHLLNNAQSLGFVLHDSASGKFTVFSLPGISDAGTHALAAWKMNSPTSYAGAYWTYSKAMVTGGQLPTLYRIRDDGTFRTVAISPDGEVWLTVDIQFNNDFQTPTHFGYALRGTGSGIASIMTVVHEAVTQP